MSDLISPINIIQTPLKIQSKGSVSFKAVKKTSFDRLLLSTNSKSLIKETSFLKSIFIPIATITSSATLSALNVLDINKEEKQLQFEKAIKNFDFCTYGKEGLPLKYPRKQFIQDITNVLVQLPEDGQESVLAKFNLTKGQEDIDGIPNIDVQVSSEIEKKILDTIQKYYQNNVEISDNAVKQAIDGILLEHPEFTMIIGKPQHKTHWYSVDIHSLSILNNIYNNPDYNKLSGEGKEIIKHSALMHDYGKKGNVITAGHAISSKEYALKILEKNEKLSSETKEKIINQIENHHWFEGYNKGYLSAKDFVELFPSEEEQRIALLLAKADFETVNPHFHLKILTGTPLSHEEYQKTFEKIMDKLKRDISLK